MKTNRKASKAHPKSRWAKPALEILEDRLAPANVAIVSAGLGGLDFPQASVLNDLLTHGFTVYLAEWNSPTFNTYDGKDSPADEAPLGKAGEKPGGFGLDIAKTTIGPFQVKVPFGGPTLGVPQITVPVIPPQVDITADLGFPNTSKDFVQEGLSLIHPGDHIVLIGHSLGGDSVIKLARAAAQQNIHIDDLITLDPVGFDNIASSTSPILNALANIGLQRVQFQVINGANNGIANDQGQVPGFRGNTLLAGGGLESVPANVGHLYNRWQTNGMFPIDFGDSGELQLDSPAQTTSDQGVQNTTDRYTPDITNELQDLAYLFGRVDLNPFTFRTVKVFGNKVQVPSLNGDFNTSIAQLHYNLPENQAITDQLIQLINGTFPTPITASGGGSTITIQAGPDPSHVTVTIDNGPKQTVAINQNQIVVDGQGGNDKLVLDFSAGNFIAGNKLIYNGGGGKNTLVLEGGSFSKETITSVNPTTSIITLDSGTIEANQIGDGLTDPAGGIVDLVPVTDFSFLSVPLTLSADMFSGGQFFSVVNGDVEGGFQTTLIRSDPVFLFTGTPPQPFVQVDFANKTNVQVVGSPFNDTITLANSNPATRLDTLTVNPGTGSDAVNVLDTASTVTTTVTSSGGTDLVTVGRGTPSVLDGIQGPLDIENPAAFTDLVIDDSGDSNAASQVTISASQVTGLSQGAISFTEDDLSSLKVLAGSGGNRITLASTPRSQFRGTGGTPQTTTTLLSGAGDDFINVQGTGGGPLDVQGQGGSNTLTVDFSNGNAVSGGLTFDGGTDPTKNNRLVLKGGSFINEVYTPSGVGSGSITFANGGPVLANIGFSNLRPIDDTVGATNDTINGTAAAEPINIIDHIGLVDGSRATQIDSGNSPTFELVSFANKANVVVNGVGGSDTFTLNNPNPAAGLSSLTLNGSGAGNTFNVQALAVATTVNAGGGKNTVNLHDASNSLAQIKAALTLNGQGGTNTLNAANANDFTLTNTSLASGPVNVTLDRNFQIANLTDTGTGQTFDVSAWTGGGSLLGQRGNDTVLATNDADFTLTDSSLDRTGHGTLALQGIDTATLTGGPSPNTFTVSGWHGSGRLDGQGGPDTVVATDDTNFTLGDTSLARTGFGTMKLESIERATLTGGASANTFTVSGWNGDATLDGKDGGDTYNVFMGSGGTVRIHDTGTAGTDRAFVFGTDSGDTFTVTPTRLTDGHDTVTFDANLEQLTVNGGVAPDVFNVTPSAATTFFINGGPPLPPSLPGDTLGVDLDGAAGAFRTATPTSSGYQGSWTFTDRKPIHFTGIETLKPDLQLSGSGTPVEGFEQSATNATVATFTNRDFLVPAGDFSAVIDWGDGTTSSGAVSLSGTTYIVQGDHTYTDERSYPVTVTVSGDNASATFTATALLHEELTPAGTPGTPNQRFVSELFRDLLHRPVDPASLDHWAGALDHGASPFSVVMGIESTPEYLHLVVGDLFQKFLHRAPGAFEMSLDTLFLSVGVTPEMLGTLLVSTPEFFFGQGGGNVFGFLAALYRDAMGRPIHSDEQFLDLALLGGGVSLPGLVFFELAQPEYKLDLVDGYFQQLLDHTPTRGEAAPFTESLELFVPDQVVVAQIATAPPDLEFIQKVNR